MEARRAPDARGALQTEGLWNIIEAITGELELRPLLTTIVRHACELLEADRGSIGLVDPARGVVRTEAVYRMPEGELGAEMPRGVGLAGQVLETLEPLIVNRYGDVRRPTRPEILDDAVIGMPIFWQGKMLGFFGIGASPPHRFSDADAEKLSLLARYAAIAIHNARQFETEKRRRARVTAVSRIGQLVTGSLSLGEVLQTTVEAIMEHLNYSSVGVFLLDPEDLQRVVLRARSGLASHIKVGTYSQAVNQGNVGLAAKSRKAVFVADVTRDPRYIPFTGDRMQSELAVPIVVGERLLGVLNVESETVISKDDITGLEIVADQLGTAIENARLFAETEAALGEMELLYRTSQRIGGAADVGGVVTAYLEQVALRRRYGCSVFIFTRNAAGAREDIVILGRWRPDEGITQPNSRHAYFSDFFDSQLDAGQTVTIADTETDPRVSDTLRAAQRTSGRPALALIPLMVRGERVGGVSLNYPAAHAWSEADLRPYQVTAAQLATAIYSRQQQAQFLEQEQKLAVWAERQRLSRELHDSVTQLLFSMTLVAQSVGPAMQRSQSEGEARVAKLLELAQKARAEMRALLVELRTPAVSPLADMSRVEQSGLVHALKAHHQGLETDTFKVALNTQAYTRQAVGLEQALFRIVQEALTNTVKHAHATRAEVTLQIAQGTCCVTVQDNGHGFNPTASKEGHFGLKTMRERTEALAGRLEVASTPEGTRVSVVVPLT